jgi:hypothetical protein
MIPLLILVVVCLGCSSANKLRVPLAEIDRPIVAPKGTWSADRGVGVYLDVRDTVSYRGIIFNDPFLTYSFVGALVTPASYSLTDNLSLPCIPFPYLVWQLTKSPLVDTNVRYKWQFALAGGVTNILEKLAYGNIRFAWKKRLSPSAWYQGAINEPLGYTSGKGIIAGSPQVSNAVGFQLSPKASVLSALALYYTGSHTGGTGSFNLHYSFYQWFSLNVGSGIGIYNDRNETAMTFNIGSEFYW